VTTLAVLCVAGCGGGSAAVATGPTGPTNPPGGGTPDTGNTATLVVDSGPTGISAGIVNTPYVTVTICAPGTTNCQTIDHVSVDTGSSGFRVLGSVLNSTLANALKIASNTQSQPYYECLQFADGYSWGPVTAADVKIAGETASNLPIHIIGSTQVAVPSGCSGGAGQAENTVNSFGANGILGIAQFQYDCDTYCSTAPAPEGAYYSCTNSTSSGTCTAAVMPLIQQVPNPVFSFPTDNNGTIITLPSLSNAGGANTTGQLIFGIDTQSNNALGNATVLHLDGAGNFTAAVNGGTNLTNGGFIDSGSNAYFFTDMGTTVCTSATAKGFYCPAALQSLQATVSSNGVTATVQFLVQSADVLFAGNNGNNTAFNDLAGPTTIPGGPTNGSTDFFDFGLPFFFGRSVYTAVEGKSTSAGAAVSPFNAFK
jgi:hypothetical protein